MDNVSSEAIQNKLIESKLYQLLIRLKVKFTKDKYLHYQKPLL